MPAVSLSHTGQIRLPEVLRHALGLQASALLEVPLDNDRRVRTRVLSGPAQPWTRWRGRLAGTQTLQTYVVDHVDDVCRERLS
jgi:hypothetical protein